MDICISYDPLMHMSLHVAMHVPRRTCQMHVPTVPNDQLRDHMIMSENKCFVIYRHKDGMDSVCAANAIAFP